MSKITPIRALIVVVLLAAAAQTTLAHDYFGDWEDRTWNRGDAGSTYQAWEFPRYDLSSPTGVDWTRPNSDFTGNPYGTAHIWAENAEFPSFVAGPDSEQTPTLHLGDYDPDTADVNRLEIWIPNNPVENWVKRIFIQITADHGPWGGHLPGIITSTGTTEAHISSPQPAWQHSGTWYTYNWLIEVYPNPEWEKITFVFPGSTNIEQIVVDTICTDVPEPGSLMVLGSGAAAALLALRRRKNS